MSEIAYFLSVMLSLALYACAGWLIWQAVELIYWVYCKVTGKKY